METGDEDEDWGGYMEMAERRCTNYTPHIQIAVHQKPEADEYTITFVAMLSAKLLLAVPTPR